MKASSQILDLCNSSAYLYLPALSNALVKTMQDPSADIEIKDDLLQPPEHSLLVRLIVRVKNTWLHFLHNLKSFFSPNYRKSFNLAAGRISDKYEAKNKELNLFKETCKETKKQVNELISTYKNLQQRQLSCLNETTQVKDEIKKAKEKEELLLAKAHEYYHAKASYTNILWGIVGGSSQEKIQKKKELKQLDPDFPTHDPDAIDKYQDGLLETRTYKQLNALKEKKEALKKQKETLNSEQRDAQDRYRALKANLDDLRRTHQTLELKQLKLKLDQLFVAETATSEETPEPTASLLDLFKDDILTKTGCQQLSEIWFSLFQRFDPEKIQQWTCDEHGNFTMKLASPLTIWLPCNDPKGGTVMLFGHNPTSTLKGKLSDHSIEFSEGTESYCDTQKFLIGITTAKFNKMTYTKEAASRPAKATITGSLAGFSGSKDKVFDDLKQIWANEGEIISNDPAVYKPYLLAKIRAA